MGKTAIFLVVSLIAAPLLAYFDDPLSAAQMAMAKVLFFEFVFFWLLCFVVAEITKNYSQTDKLWSITPIVYGWTAAAMSDWDPRMVLVAALITVWGVRLTYNFGRMGGYSGGWRFWDGHQDYRWDYVRKTTPMLDGPWRWRAFNLLFIAGYQHGLVLLITLPIIMLHGVGAPLGWLDNLLSMALLGLIALETVADRQQWDFQTEKYRRKNAGETLTGPYAKGFNHLGLWGKSRHPNYFGEQSIWVVVFLFSAVFSGLNWTIIGCLLLIVLFRNSSELAETISAEKYPDYQSYRESIPRFLPIGNYKG